MDKDDDKILLLFTIALFLLCALLIVNICNTNRIEKELNQIKIELQT